MRSIYESGSPQPLTDEYQKLDDVNVAGNRPWRLVEESRFGNRFLVFDFDGVNPADSCEIYFSIRFRVTRYAILPLSEHKAIAATTHDAPAPAGDGTTLFMSATCEKETAQSALDRLCPHSR